MAYRNRWWWVLASAFIALLAMVIGPVLASRMGWISLVVATPIVAASAPALADLLTILGREAVCQVSKPHDSGPTGIG